MSKIIGYIRVSTYEQNPDRQLDGIQCDKIFTDKASGKDRNRPQLEEMLNYVRDGDTIIIHSMDWLARNLDDLRKIVNDLTMRNITIKFLKENLTFRPGARETVTTGEVATKPGNHPSLHHTFSEL